MWFDMTAGNILGAVIGTLIGVFSGIWGVAAGVNAAGCKRRGVILGMGKVLICFGIVSLLFGIVALACGQPRHVWYAFILIGCIAGAGLCPAYLAVKAAYEKAEMKKMALDDL